MKIGIVTFHYAHNFGALLQTYALQTKLQQMGHEVYIINYIVPRIYENYSLLSIDRKNKSFLKKIKARIIKIITIPLRYKKYIKFKNFIKSNLNLTRKYKDEEDLQKNFPKYDIYITGSDQVWNTEIVGFLSDVYTLNFGDEKIRRVSYAASIGKNEVQEKELKEFKEKLKMLDKISVREQTAKKILSKVLDKKIEVVLDPTLLIEREKWDEIIKNYSNVPNQKYILAYRVAKNQEYINTVNYIAKMLNLKVIHFNKKDDINEVLRVEENVNPFEFVNLIKNAEFIITNSFHATVFSSIYHKKFVVIPNSKTGNRVTNLLEKIGLENHVIYSLEEFKTKDMKELDDYENVDNKLKQEQKQSLKFLEESTKF